MLCFDLAVTVFRFCRRARFSRASALKLLHSTLTYRLTSSLSTLTPSPLYTSNPLFFFHPSLFDKFGRPCAVLNLRHVRRDEDGGLEGIKGFVRWGWEVGRRWLGELSEQGEGSGGVKVQMVVVVDLEGAGMTNLVRRLCSPSKISSNHIQLLTRKWHVSQEVELLPFFMDLLKNHFPGMVGASTSCLL